MSDSVSNVNEEGRSTTDDPGLWVSHPINIRVTLPFFASRYYFTFVAGREKRCPARLHDERVAYPLLTIGNAMFGLGITTVLTLAALTFLILRSAIIEF